MTTTQAQTDDTEREKTAPCGGITVLRNRLNEGTSNPDDLDLIYDSLSNHRRRQMLYLLEAAPDKSATVPDLASTIAAWEMDIDRPDTVNYDERKSVQSTIYQHHAPKMADAGLIEFDKRTSRLELADRAARLELTGDGSDVGGSTTDDGGWALLDVASAGTAAVAVSVAATATVPNPTTVFVALAASAATGFAAWNRFDL